jgi:Tfp pilus assembly protein PilO
MKDISKLINLKILQDFFARLSKREKTVFYSTVGILFVLFFVNLFLGPSLDNIEELNQEIINRKKTINVDLRLVGMQEVIEKETKKYTDYFVELGSSEDEIINIQKEIQNLANDTGVYVGYIRPADITNEGIFKIYHVSVNCEGEMPKMVKFIYDVESSSKLLTVERYTITPKSEGSSVSQCRMMIAKTAIP